MGCRGRDPAVLVGGVLVVLAAIWLALWVDRPADRRCAHQMDWIVGGCRP